MVVARPNHVDAIGIDAAHQANLLSLLSMERKDGIEPTYRSYDAIAFERMRTQLAQVGRMAHGNNWHAPDALARQCGHQIQVMADHQIGPKLSHRPIDCSSKCPLKCLEHRRRQVTIACRGIGHDIGHAADGKRQLGRLERHGKHSSTPVQLALGITRCRAAKHGGAMSRLDLLAHERGKVGAAAGAIWFLCRDIEDAHIAVHP